MIRRRIIIVALTIVVFAVGWWVGRGGAADGLYGNLDLFVEVLSRVEENYVDDVAPQQLVDGAIRGMLRDLDPYSQFLDEKSLSNLESVTQGSFGGIGIVVSVRDHYPTVISPIEGTPAWEAGLQSGDVIVEIDGESSFDENVEDVADKLRGPEGTQVTVSIRREGQPEDEIVTLTRRIIETPSVPYAFKTDDHVGYLRLSNFSEKAGEETRDAIAELRKQGAKSLVFDLRQNPGGLLDQAVEVAEQFLPKGTMVVYTDGRVKAQNNRYYAAENRPELRWPMVVLVDQGSASASEIVAGALQDVDRALVLGWPTFGKGSVQSVFPLAGRTAALKLTTALYHTPSGRVIHKVQNGEIGDLAAFDEDGEIVEEPQQADPAVQDEQRPEYKTAAGRLVYGGGGITPDFEVKADSLPPVVLKVERANLPFKFANSWVNTHDDVRAGEGVTSAQWTAYVDLINALDDPPSADAIAAHREALQRGIRREMARRLEGDAAAARIALEGDPIFQRAFEVLREARRPDDVFAAAEEEAPARTASR